MDAKIKELATMLKNNGCKVMIKDDSKNELTWETDYFFFSLSEDDNIIFYIEKTRLFDDCITCSVKYVPSRENGSGCRIIDETSISNISIDTFKEIRKNIQEYGLRYYNRCLCRKCPITLYANINVYYDKYWDKDKWLLL